jgi:hypothetical protein
MIKTKCQHCGYDGDQVISFNFNSGELEKIESGLMLEPKFRLRCDCADCGKYIKFLPFKGNLKDLHNKSVNY